MRPRRCSRPILTLVSIDAFFETKTSNTNLFKVLGKSLAIFMKLFGRSVRTDPALAAELKALTDAAAAGGPNMSRREVKHVQAVEQFAYGNRKETALIWEEILLEHPTDILALKQVQDTYLFTGAKKQMRDSVARVYPYWFPGGRTSTIPLNECVHGLYAFGLEEAGCYAQAEQQALLGLSKNARDGWTTHALAHVYEMCGRSREGIEFMSSTQHNWIHSNWIASHNFWHRALYHINEGEPEAAVELFEAEILPRAMSSDNMLEMIDSTSLLYRLDLLDQPPQASWTTADKWPKLDTLTKPLERGGAPGFIRSHFMMSCLANDRIADAQEILEDLRKKDGELPALTCTLLEAMLDFKLERYRGTIDKLLPIRYDLYKLGASDAQRDVYQQLLIAAAAKVDTKLWQRLLIERQAAKGQHDFVTKQWRGVGDDRA